MVGSCGSKPRGGLRPGGCGEDKHGAPVRECIGELVGCEEQRRDRERGVAVAGWLLQTGRAFECGYYPHRMDGGGVVLSKFEVIVNLLIPSYH